MIEFGIEKAKPCCGGVVEMDEVLYQDYKEMIEDDRSNMVKCRDCNSRYDVRKMVNYYHVCKWNR